MLRLPNNWRLCSAQYVVEKLLRQADESGNYPIAARAFARASLEYMLSGPRWVNRSERASLVRRSMALGIDDWFIYVLPNLEDATLALVKKLPRSNKCVEILAPPWSVRFAKSAIRMVLPHRHVDVYPINTYVCLKLLWTCVELKQSHAESLSILLQNFQRLVRGTRALEIRFPKDARVVLNS